MYVGNSIYLCVVKIITMKSNDLMDVLITAKLINSVKKTYSEEEVKKLCRYIAEYAQENHMEYPYRYFDDWFEQNKKK